MAKEKTIFELAGELQINPDLIINLVKSIPITINKKELKAHNKLDLDLEIEIRNKLLDIKLKRKFNPSQHLFEGMNLSDNMGIRLWSLRTQYFMTAKELAERTGLSVSTIRNIEKGLHNKLSRTTFERICLVLKCNRTWLETGYEEQVLKYFDVNRRLRKNIRPAGMIWKRNTRNSIVSQRGIYRAHELAKELNITNDRLYSIAKKLSIEIKSNFQKIDHCDEELIRKVFIR